MPTLSAVVFLYSHLMGSLVPSLPLCKRGRIFCHRARRRWPGKRGYFVDASADTDVITSLYIWPERVM